MAFFIKGFGLYDARHDDRGNPNSGRFGRCRHRHPQLFDGKGTGRLGIDSQAPGLNGSIGESESFADACSLTDGADFTSVLGVGAEPAIYGDLPDLPNALAFRKGRFVVSLSALRRGTKPVATPHVRSITGPAGHVRRAR